METNEKKAGQIAGFLSGILGQDESPEITVIGDTIIIGLGGENYEFSRSEIHGQIAGFVAQMLGDV